jgi:hypothetical protein
MKRLKKKKINRQWQDRTASRIAHRIMIVQASLSRYLQKQEQRLTIKQKKIALFIFCLSGGAYFLYLLGSVLFCQPALAPSGRAIQVQQHAQPPPDSSSPDNVKIFNRQKK